MKIALISLTLLCFTSVFSQDQGIEASLPVFSKFTFGWVYSPEVSYRILGESDQSDEFTQSLIHLRNENERAKFGQSFSFFWGYKLSKIFTLEGGFGYTDFGEGRLPTTLTNPDMSVYATLAGSHHIHFVSVPLSLHVNLGGNRVRWFISAGVAPGYMSRYTTYSHLTYADGSTSTSNNYSVNAQENFSKFILGAHISGGIDFKYSEKASLRIAPVFRITATDTYSDVPIKANYFNAGIEIGTIYRL